MPDFQRRPACHPDGGMAGAFANRSRLGNAVNIEAKADYTVGCLVLSRALDLGELQSRGREKFANIDEALRETLLVVITQECL